MHTCSLESLVTHTNQRSSYFERVVANVEVIHLLRGFMTFPESTAAYIADAIWRNVAAYFGSAARLASSAARAHHRLTSPKVAQIFSKAVQFFWKVRHDTREKFIFACG